MDTRTRVLIVYFSGTGGTARIAGEMSRQMTARGVRCELLSLDRRCYGPSLAWFQEAMPNAHAFVLLYPVHAMEAPLPVREWIRDIPRGNNTPTAVISVSGGGEMWPNTGCRSRSIRRLEEKGYAVFHEGMMVMPSNVFLSTNDQVAIRLLRAVPARAGALCGQILALERHRGRLRRHALFSAESKPYLRYCADFGSRLSATPACTLCGWCRASCPRDNIRIEGGEVRFGTDCVICLRCVYGCPQGAIRTGSRWLGISPEGYSLERIEERMAGVELEPVERSCRGLLWYGVRKYLLTEGP
jgi:ferredoxin